MSFRIIKTGLCLLMLGSSATTGAADLPEAEALFAKYAELSYGSPSSGRIQSITVTAEILMQQFNITSALEVKQKAPGYRRTVGEVFGQKLRSGCTLSACWEESLDGLEIIEGKELQRWLEQADFYRWEKVDNYAKSIETLELTEWDGAEVYKVRVIDNFDQENIYYFDRNTGLMRGAELMVADLGGFQARTEIYRDYQQYGPVWLPAVTLVEQPQITRGTSIKSVSFEDIPDTAFELPEKVADMLSGH